MSTTIAKERLFMTCTSMHGLRGIAYVGIAYVNIAYAI